MKNKPESIIPDSIVWFAYVNQGSPSVRYRGIFPLETFKQVTGRKAEIIIPGYSIDKLWRFFRIYISLILQTKGNKLVVIQRVQSKGLYSILLKLLVLLRKHKIIYDIDDADYLIYSPKTIYWFAKKCDAVSAGSESIKQHLRPLNANISHITSVPVNLNISKSFIRNEIFTIGWIGIYGWGHADSLNCLLFPAILELPFPVKLILVGVKNSSDQIRIRNILSRNTQETIEFPQINNWSDECEIQNWICKFDVGIATLLDHPYQIAKSGIKAKQYLNNGVPVITNNLPENNWVVTHEFNGFVGNSSDDFKAFFFNLKKMNNMEYSLLCQNALTIRHSCSHEVFLSQLFQLYLSC